MAPWRRYIINRVLFLAVMKEESSDGFQERINKWLLTFTKPQDEEAYRQDMETRMLLPKAMWFLAYSTAAYNIGTKTYQLIKKRLDPTAQPMSFEMIVGLLVVIIVATGIEVTLKLANRLKQHQGCIVYITFMLTAIISAFYTHNAPVFGFP